MDHRFCNKCGSQRADDARFCNKCGSPFSAAVTPAATTPAPATPVATTPADPPSPVPSASRKLLLPIILTLVACLIAGAFGTVAYFLFGDLDPSSDDIFVDVGSYEFKDPDPARVVDTEEWGELPANQVAIVLEDGLSEADAQRIAEEIGGEIVGHAELINLYQIETAGTTADDLKAALATAGSASGVEAAVPNILTGPRSALEGRSCSPLNDPMYSERTNGRAYEMIGLQDAWDIIRASGVELNRTRIGVIDSILYTDSGHGFTPELNLPDEQGRHAAGKVRTIPIQRGRDATATVQLDSDGELDLGGMGHGTAVTHVIAADTSGGTAGVAGILGENLEVLVSVTGSGRSFVGGRDPDNPVQWGSWTFGHLEGMLEQIENGATVINCSWGPETLGSQNADGSGMMRKFLRIMAERHPQVIFVAAAGNSGQGVTDSNDYWGKDLPNLVTVGALNHDGERAQTRDWFEQADLERGYQQRLDAGTIQPGTTLDQWIDSILSGSNFANGGEITLSASGTGVPVGIGPNGKTLTEDGTSFASPQVAGAIALMRSIDPDISTAAIKRILTQTAAREVRRDDRTTTVPANMGAGVLRVDAAVLQVINEMRAGPPDAPDYPRLPPLDRETLLARARVQLQATRASSSAGGGGQEWIVTASIAEVSDGGTQLQLKTSGQGVVSGNTTQRLAAPGEVSWKIDVRDEHFTVRVFRLDTNGCATLELTDTGPLLEGTWAGTVPRIGFVPAYQGGGTAVPPYISTEIDVAFEITLSQDENGDHKVRSLIWKNVGAQGAPGSEGDRSSSVTSFSMRRESSKSGGGPEDGYRGHLELTPPEDFTYEIYFTILDETPDTFGASATAKSGNTVISQGTRYFELTRAE